MLLKEKDCPEITLKRQKGCGPLFFAATVPTAVVISLQKPPLCGGGADELWSNRVPILPFTSKYPQIRTIPNILIISTDL